ncbi:MAG: chemotaxis protein CheX [Verrucomicrobiota bacterium]
MNTTAQTDEIARRFGIESIPESVKRLHELIAKRDASLEDFARLVARDAELAARLLRAANPRAEREADYTTTTVEEALQRTGLSSALLLAMSEPLVRAVTKSFRTMLKVELRLLAATAINPFKTGHILGEVSFAGKANGLVHLRLPTSALPLIGERLLGLSPAEANDPATANDVIGELCNMIVGNFKSNLCDAGLTCKLSPPKITQTAEFKLRVVNGGTSQRYGFQARELDFFADLSVNPWHD